MLSRLTARMLLSECRGDEIWPVTLCRKKGVPEPWLEELADCFESGYRTDRETIYYEEHAVNQYHGVRDIDLAYKLADFLGVNTGHATQFALGRSAEVRALKEAADEL